MAREYNGVLTWCVSETAVGYERGGFLQHYYDARMGQILN